VKLNLPAGKYIVAVSGGVDSMVLLDLLSKQENLELVVAHFDHGIRTDSHLDKQLVEEAAQKYGLASETAEGKLGATTSEDTARKARYKFLNDISKKHGAKAVVTAHHQDDLIETALLNMLRGTGRKGLSSLQSSPFLLRPFLAYTKHDIQEYAARNDISWREDSTNADTAYLRNYIRQNLIPKLSSTKKRNLVKLLDDIKDTNQKLDNEIANYLQSKDKNLQKNNINQLPHRVAAEIIAFWLRQHDIRDFNKKTIERLLVAAKTLRPGQRVDVNKKNYLLIGKDTLEIKNQHPSNTKPSSV
jgi:tRNA(Ile)-lysidine synthetase-like protein